MSNAVLEVKELVKVFGETRAVDGLSFHVEQGEIFALLGPNGAGKSTTIRCLTTLLHLTSGSIAVCGHDVVKEPDAVRTCLGYVPQELALDRHLITDTAMLEEHVLLWCDLMRTRVRARPGVTTPPPRPPEWVFR